MAQQKINLTALLIVLLLGCSISFASVQESIATRAMISTSHSLATKAGLKILRRGGNAVDAAIAAQMMLTLVEPQSSGIGGGAFLLYWSAKEKKLYTFDGRERAPLAANEKLFTIDGEVMKWRNAAVSGKSVGVPGVLAMLEMAHGRFGNLTWRSLFKPAINKARKGFAVSKVMAQRISSESKHGLGSHPATKKYLFDKNGDPLKAGHILKNKELARTLTIIAKKGSKSFYRGKIAKDIVATVKQSNVPGLLSLKDFKEYQAKERKPICKTYRKYKVCGMGPPTSGGITTLQILGLLERFDLSSYSPLSLQAVHLFTQANRLAYADRNAHMADIDYYPVPVNRLLDSKYISQRSYLINSERDMGHADPGFPQPEGKDISYDSTAHMSIVDTEGNAISMTTTVEKIFGSTLMTNGFILNNQLTDFSFADKNLNGSAIANRVEGGKRPRSSMSPTIVFDENDVPILLVGSPGGSRIINYTTRTIIAILDWGLSLSAALALPHYMNRNDVTELERGTKIVALKNQLEKMGHQVKESSMVSGINAIQITENALIGSTDPRGEGLASGF